MEYLIVVLFLGTLPAIIARNKGYSFLGWWIFGSLLFIVALPWALLMGPQGSAPEPVRPWERNR